MKWKISIHEERIRRCRAGIATDVLGNEPRLTRCFSFSVLPFTVIIAADQSNARSILIYQTNIDKIKELTSHSMMGVSGPNCDLVNFTEYVFPSKRSCHTTILGYPTHLSFDY